MLIESTLGAEAWQNLLRKMIRDDTGVILTSGDMDKINAVYAVAVRTPSILDKASYLVIFSKVKGFTYEAAESFIKHIAQAQKDAPKKDSPFDKLLKAGGGIIMVAGILGVAYIVSTVSKYIPQEKRG